MIRQAFKYRLYPTRAQEAALVETLDRCRDLYNAALQERRAAYRMAGKTITYYQQKAELPAVKDARPEYRTIYSQVLQDVILRLDRAFLAFFRRAKAGDKLGYPRFQGKRRYDSFTYPQYGNGASLSYTNGARWGWLTLSKLGSFKVRMHRPIAGTMSLWDRCAIKTVTIHRDGDQWYACFNCEVEPIPLPPTDTTTGVDLGLLHFATLSDGSTIENPRPLRRSLAKLKRAQRALARCKRGSHRRARARQRVARIYRKVRNQHADFCHKQARQLVNTYGVIVFEDLRVPNLIQNHHLALSISDVGWGQFVQCCVVKAASAGRAVLFVDPRYTSQACSGCGAITRKALSDRWHSCECGAELDRDHNAAINILRLGSSQQTGSVCKSSRS